MTPFSIVLSQEETRLKKFRRALRAEDRKHFDELFEHARRNIQAAVQAAASGPTGMPVSGTPSPTSASPPAPSTSKPPSRDLSINDSSRSSAQLAPA